MRQATISLRFILQICDNSLIDNCFQTKKKPVSLSVVLNKSGIATGDMFIDDGDNDVTKGHPALTFSFTVTASQLYVECAGNSEYVEVWNASNVLAIGEITLLGRNETISQFYNPKDKKLRFKDRVMNIVHVKCEASSFKFW